MLLHVRKDQYNPFGLIINARSNPSLDQVLLYVIDLNPLIMGLKREK